MGSHSIDVDRDVAILFIDCFGESSPVFIASHDSALKDCDILSSAEGILNKFLFDFEEDITVYALNRCLFKRVKAFVSHRHRTFLKLIFNKLT